VDGKAPLQLHLQPIEERGCRGRVGTENCYLPEEWLAGLCHGGKYFVSDKTVPLHQQFHAGGTAALPHGSMQVRGGGKVIPGDEEVPDGEARRLGQFRVEAGLGKDLAPDEARNVGENAAAVPFAVDLAGPVSHLDKGLDGPLHIAVGRPDLLVDVTDDGTGIPFDGKLARRVVMGG